MHKLILIQARSLAASLAFHNGNNEYSWDKLSIYDQADIYNVVICFYARSKSHGIDDCTHWIAATDECAPIINDAYIWDNLDTELMRNLYDILMRTTACLAHLEAPAFLDLFDVGLEGEGVKVTLKPGVSLDWAKPEDFEVNHD